MSAPRTTNVSSLVHVVGSTLTSFPPAVIREDRYKINKPVLHVGCLRDAVNVAQMTLSMTQEWCLNLTSRVIDTGHWPQLEQPKLLSSMLLDWVEYLNLQKNRL